MRTIHLIAAGAALAIVAAGCGSSSSDNGSSGQSSPNNSASSSDSDVGSEGSAAADLDLVNSGVLTMCTDAPYKPFDYEENGEYTGFDVEIVRSIAKGLGLGIKVQQTGFDGIQSGAALESDSCDLAAAAMTITDERAKHLDFSDGYYDSLQSLLVPDGSSITELDQLDGKTIGVQQGTTGADYAHDNAPDGAKIISYDGEANLYQAAKAGNVDAVLQDLPVNVKHAKDGDFEVVQRFDTGESYGLAVKKDRSDDLLSDLNDGLATLKDDGTYDDLYKQFFGTTPDES